MPPLFGKNKQSFSIHLISASSAIASEIEASENTNQAYLDYLTNHIFLFEYKKGHTVDIMSELKSPKIAVVTMAYPRKNC